MINNIVQDNKEQSNMAAPISIINEDVSKFMNFCKHVTPMITSCAGFVRTDGYLTFVPGHILMMSDDETFFIDVIYNENSEFIDYYPGYIVSSVNSWVSNVNGYEDNKFDFNTLSSDVYRLGYNIKRDKLINYFNMYNNILPGKELCYHEPDCMINMQKFSEYASSTEIRSISIIDKYNRICILPVSKVFTPNVKGDSISVEIFDYVYNQDSDISPYNRTIKYTIYKKKFKSYSYVYANIILP